MRAHEVQLQESYIVSPLPQDRFGQEFIGKVYLKERDTSRDGPGAWLFSVAGPEGYMRYKVRAMQLREAMIGEQLARYVYYLCYKQRASQSQCPLLIGTDKERILAKALLVFAPQILGELACWRVLDGFPVITGATRIPVTPDDYATAAAAYPKEPV